MRFIIPFTPKIFMYDRWQNPGKSTAESPEELIKIVTGRHRLVFTVYGTTSRQKRGLLIRQVLTRINVYCITLGVESWKREGFSNSSLTMSQTEDNGDIDNPANFNKVCFQARLCDRKKKSTVVRSHRLPDNCKTCHIPL